MTEQDKTSTHKKLVIISLNVLQWNPNNYVYHPEFDLGIGEEWFGIKDLIISCMELSLLPAIFSSFTLILLHSVFVVCPSSRSSECDLHHILKISVMTVDTLYHQSFWSPLKISKAIYRLNLHHGLPINHLAQDHQMPVNNDYQPTH